MINSVYHFNEVTLNIAERPPGRLSKKERAWLIMALTEELDELDEALTLAEDVDALIDLIYFAIGGLYRLGLSSDQARDCFDIVHNVNLKKKAGVKPTRPQDGSVTDAIKPDDLPDPLIKIQEILSR